MTEKEQLMYLIEKLLNGSYEIRIFCDEFVRIYNFEFDYTSLSKQEKIQFNEMRNMAARFSDNPEELKIPNMFFSKSVIMNKARNVQQILKNK